MSWLVFTIFIVGLGVVRAIRETAQERNLGVGDTDVGVCFVCQQTKVAPQLDETQYRACHACRADAEKFGRVLLAPSIGIGQCGDCGRSAPLHVRWPSMGPSCFDCWQGLEEASRRRRAEAPRVAYLRSAMPAAGFLNAPYTSCEVCGCVAPLYQVSKSIVCLACIERELAAPPRPHG